MTGFWFTITRLFYSIYKYDKGKNDKNISKWQSFEIFPRIRLFCKKQREFIEINPIHLPKGSHVIVTDICDNCKVEKMKEFRTVKFENEGTTFCNKCRFLFKERKKRIYTENKKELMIENIKKTFNEHQEKDPNWLKNIQNKAWATKLQKYSASTYNNQILRKSTLLSNHGAVNFNNQEKRKKTLRLNHGFETYNNQEKKKETCIKKYGVEHTNQVPEIFLKIQKSAFLLKQFENTSLYYRGSYEFHFLNFCKTNNILIDFENAPMINYYADKNRKYYPDFYHRASNTIIEIKSTYTLNKDLKINLLKKEAAIKLGFNFIFIVDKDYSSLELIIPNFSINSNRISP